MNFRLIHLAAPAASFAALAAAVPAAAQDQGNLWSGLYVGLNAGAAWSDNTLRPAVAPGTGIIVIPPADIPLINGAIGNSSYNTGFTGGIEGGYNYRIGNYLLGVETDFVALGVNDHTTTIFQSPLPTLPAPPTPPPLTTPPLLPTSPPGSPATYVLNQQAKTSWMWSFRPRVGYVFGPWLAYATAGVAVSDVKVGLGFSDNHVPPNVILNESSKTRAGWIAGLGAAYAFSPNWSAKGEWLYADFGSFNTTAFSPTSFVTLTSESKVRSNILRFGVDYRF
jgi:outer membrane immunogenic protein